MATDPLVHYVLEDMKESVFLSWTGWERSTSFTIEINQWPLDSTVIF